MFVKFAVSIHLTSLITSGHSVGKYEVHSSVLNVCIGAKNLMWFFFFNLAFSFYFLRLYLAACKIIQLKLYTDMDKFEKLIVAGVILFGTIHTIKESLLCLVSILSNTSYLERAQGFKKIYFKSGHDGFLINPFDKGSLVNIKEVLWTTFGLKKIVDPLDRLPKLDFS
jgi:hypothetical protein